MAVRGLNHLTLAVSDLERSVAFYTDLLGFRLRVLWRAGAYLEGGSLWLCLSLDEDIGDLPAGGYTHYAFDISEGDFAALCARIRARAIIWKENRSEGASLYFLDPDGHRLEVHAGDLLSRLASYRMRSDVRCFD